MPIESVVDLVLFRLQSALGSVAGQAVSDDLIRRAIVTIPTADVKALAGTPYTIVAAPNAGEYIEFLSAQFFMLWNSAAYTSVVGNTWGILFESGSQCSKTMNLGGFLDATSNQYLHLTASDEFKPEIATALQLVGLDTEVNTGDSDVMVEVAYRVRTALS